MIFSTTRSKIEKRDSRFIQRKIHKAEDLLIKLLMNKSKFSTTLKGKN